MESIRKWFYRPKRDDTSLLAQFFYANEALTAVACELDSFDGRQEPERCTTLVNQLRHCQDKVLTICNQIMDELIPDSRANRDFRVKFPDDVMQENLAGQLWFGAECLAAGSSIMNREVESSAMRPLAKALTKSLEIVRNLLREHALKGHMNLKELFQVHNPMETEKLIESLKIFDRLFADFELCYVAAMVPVKSTKEYEQQELVCVLFSETLQRALERGLLNQADVDNYDPALMFTIPRLAIVSGLLAPPGGPLCLNSADTISEMFRPFRNLLLKIRELLWTLNNRELYMLEKLLCSNEEPTVPISPSTRNACQHELENFVHNFYSDYPNCKNFAVDFYTVTKNNGTNMDEVANDVVEIMTQESNVKGERKLQQAVSVSGNSEDEDNHRTIITTTVAAYPHAYSSLLNGGESSLRVVIDDDGNDNGNSNSNSNTNADSDSRRRRQDHLLINSVNRRETAASVLPINEDQRADRLRHNASSKFTAQLVSTITNPANSSEQSLSGQLDSNSTESQSSMLAINPRDSHYTTGSNELLQCQNDEIGNKNYDNTPDNFYSNNDIASTNVNVDLPQNYLLDQITHNNNNVTDDNLLVDVKAKKLISEANKTLSNLLLEGDCGNEISEQTDSGICTVISSENTSLYDKSPEEKKTFANEIDDDHQLDDDKNLGSSCTYVCSTSEYKNSNDESCVCPLRRSTFDNHNCVSNTSNSNCNCNCNCMGSSDTSKITDRISSNFNGTNEEFVGLAYGNGQVSVCDSNTSSIQINYSDNWENLNLNINPSTPATTKEFWQDIKCKNYPSTSDNHQDINNKIGNNIERYAQHKMSVRKAKEFKLKKRQRRFERKIVKKNHNSVQEKLSYNVSAYNLSLSTESSRSNSVDRCVNPRLTSYGGSLHPTQNNMRQMPNFSNHHHSPQRSSSRLNCQFESSRTDMSQKNHNLGQRTNTSGISPPNRKLLDHRRSRAEQITKMRKKDVSSAVQSDNITRGTTNLSDNKKDELPNDGLGRRTDKTGLIAPGIESGSPGADDASISDGRSAELREKSSKNRCTVVGIKNPPAINISLIQRSNPDVDSSSSYDSSSETSEFQSDCQDDEEIALAMQAAEIANRNQIRAKFRSSEDLVHRLFVCIAGVADQLQTNFASDLRNILKCVFLMNSTSMPGETDQDTIDTKNNNNNISGTADTQSPTDDDNLHSTEILSNVCPITTERGEECVERAPAWIPDNDAPRCMACQAGFTVVRRRHHCRNCGKVFCGRCSSNNVPLPRYGHTKPVRVCNRCFLYQVTPFTVSHVASTS
ncbi:hypothetical protein G9C98_004402 [Cotesia typhae]|uniref:Lateral signaling target protein 2 homolog n=1 Tax=Cotesia typhae TaxID=2053667 RepID=A0A8J5UUE2_9HYME|nr:hypothetical protein G9C98_004402 [Cotesia typhae]